MMRSAHRLIAGSLTFSVFFACASTAGQDVPTSAERKPEASPDALAIRTWGLMWPGWDKHLSTTVKALHDENWKGAQDAANELLWKLADNLPLEQGIPTFFARALALLALADFGAGAEREGAWHWHVAQNLDPGIIELNFDGFGRPSSFLHKYPALEARVSFRSCTQRAFMAATLQASSPEIIYKPEMRYPYAIREGYAVKSVRVCVIITEEGQPEDPIIHLPSPQNAIMAFAVTEHLRRWKFKPAMKDGVPTEAYMDITFNFDLDD